MKELLMNLRRNKITKKLIVGGIAFLIIIVAIILLIPEKTKADTEILTSLIVKSSELTSAKLKYTGMTEFKDGGIAFINKADFIMVYSAEVRAGIDVEDVKITADDSKKIIYLTIPKAEVQEVKVDSKSIKYFDEKFALFKTDEKENNNEAIVLAEEAARKEAENMGILKYADDQAETLIRGIIANAIPKGYTIKKAN